MQRRFATGALLTALTVFAAAGPARADSAKFPLKGLAKSGSNSGTGTTPAVVIDNTAAPSTAAGSGKVLVLTQACFRVDAGVNTVTLAAAGTTISFAASNSNAGAGCQTFNPGFVVPEGGDVTCAANGTAAFTCSAAGVVTKTQ
ncbi:MAG TPA: hypothetical protein VL049_11640 [Candidatus Dormibacteraeota bacterium]|nr:hypothetical protein [Candidatus Dormibacteraeota bacterium]